MIIDDPTPQDSELVIGLVSPIGTPVDEVVATLQSALKDYGYDSEAIQLSRLLDETAVGGPGVLPSSTSEVGYYSGRMDAGDTLRKRFKSGDALAAYAISRINACRMEATDSNSQARRFSWILRTLKHPDEVRLLRTVYRRRFLLVGIGAPESERIDYLVSRSATRSRADAQKLVERDELDQANKYGQQVRKAFSMSDIFLDAARGRPVEAATRRVVGLIFGEPFKTPTHAEQAMFYAQASALRSAAFGRQVGAVLVGQRGEILATGTNEVPRPGGGEYWEGDVPDHRDHLHGRDFNRAKLSEVTAEVMRGLTKAKWFAPPYNEISAEDLASNALATQSDGTSILGESRIRSLIEFGRIAHAEMSAISDAARRGVSTQDAVLYTTTYPCHMCARIIINAGIKGVVFIDPYEKSLVSEMYGDLVDQNATYSNGRVNFSRFVGVAPPLFPLVFKGANREASASGDRVAFVRETARLRLAESDTLAGAVGLEQACLDALEEKINSLQAAEALDVQGGPGGF